MSLTMLAIVWMALFQTPLDSASEPPTLHAEVSMDARGFMCPFLTPMFLGYLEDRGAHWVHHDAEGSTVEFAIPLDSLSGQSDITDRLVLIGYEAKHVTFARFDTTLTVPTAPAP